MVNMNVATVPTVYGIETSNPHLMVARFSQLQQYLPFTVLKRLHRSLDLIRFQQVATVPTVYGIETE